MRTRKLQKGKLLRPIRSRSVSTRFALTALAAALGLLLVPALASAEVTPTGVTDQIHIELTKGKLKFVAPGTVTQGDELEIVNDTNPKQVGPHTFSLVQPTALPKTAKQRKSCFTPKHICLSVAMWHGFNPKTEQITVDPAKAGPAGWSTMGSTSKKGDSWFTEEKGETFSQEVTAKPGTLYFMCAVHSWMHGKVEVVPPLLTPVRWH
jgi:plastocyanin